MLRDELAHSRRVMEEDAAKFREIQRILQTVHSTDGIEHVFHEIGRAIGTATVALWNHPTLKGTPLLRGESIGGPDANGQYPFLQGPDGGDLYPNPQYQK